ncbi:MAG: anhydro-N-acetylmuramic acid kinase [Firmicutes bacterium]|nr:anhydro-N-acetylmuramic acid kinase [Bacillota bacterium]
MTELNPIISYVSKKDRLVAGLMSGTSADGVDLAITQISGNGLDMKTKVLHYQFFPYAQKLKEEILGLSCSNNSALSMISPLNFYLGEIFAEAVISGCKSAQINVSKLDLIASHGQTVYHNPEGSKILGKNIPSTIQIGESSVIASKTGVMTVSDFRPADMAAGGQGAPLVPYADFILYRDLSRSRLSLNIGGISNITYIPAAASMSEVIAFDCGPGNMVIDYMAGKFSRGKKSIDEDGKRASSGKIQKDILKTLIKHPFIKKKPPKSTGREEFGEEFAGNILKRYKKAKPDDMMATVTAFTAEAIAGNIKSFIPALPHDIILGGGGAPAFILLNLLKEKIEGVKFLTSDDFGIPLKAKEALSFAILGNETVFGYPSNVPSATGASRNAVLGKITLP